MNTDMLNEARRDISNIVEEIGAVCTHLREAMEFADTDSMPMAVASVEDALESIDVTIAQLFKIRDKAGRWAVWADGKGGE